MSLVLLAGLGPLGLAIVERLLGAGARVHAIGTAAEVSAYGHELARWDVPVTTGAAGTAGTLLAGGLDGAAVLVLAGDDDRENVDAALTARRLRGDLPLVVRLFDDSLGAYLRETLDRTTVLSMSALAAPVFADMALQALAAREPAGAAAPEAAGSARRRAAFRPDRVLVATLLGLGGLVLASTVFFARTLDLPPLHALYFVWTTVTTVGYGDIALRDASAAAKLVGMVLMFAGAAFVAVLYALFTGGVVGRRLDALRGRVPVRGAGHVVIAGAGNIGFRVAGRLAERGHRVVLVERDADQRNVDALRAAGHHVIVADAANEGTLELAGVARAGVVLVLTDSDATNLHVALAVHRRNPRVPVVARLVLRELSTHVAGRQDALAASPLAIASEAFARAALDAAARP